MRLAKKGTFDQDAHSLRYLNPALLGHCCDRFKIGAIQFDGHFLVPGVYPAVGDPLDALLDQQKQGRAYVNLSMLCNRLRVLVGLLVQGDHDCVSMP